MKVIYGISNIPKKFKNAVIAIGVFDGLHIGHQKLIRKAVAQAKANKGEAVVMTFSPHPVQVLNPQKYLPYIDSLSYRLKLLEKLGVAATIVVRFTKRFASLTPADFVQRYIVEPIAPKDVFVGDEFRFGKNAAGTIEFLEKAGKKFGFRLNAVKSLKRSRKKIGSSRIRQYIAQGQLAKARQHLGRHVAVTGKVIQGDKRGTRLGFPTVNLKVKDEVIPPRGVYAAYVWVGDQKHKAMANIGIRPSFKTDAAVHIEAHIFSFHRTIYGQEIIIEFVRKIRTEKTFPSKEALVVQLKKDRQKALHILKTTSSI